MLCSRARTALSARLDEEDLPPGVTGRRLEEHLTGCADCRAWEVKALRLRRDVTGDVPGDVTGSSGCGGQAPHPGSPGGSFDGPGPASGSPGRRAC
ncbi:zf-HC2 domain-containing protein [Streptomyces sp. WMMB 322]|uniref:zf-HC2 domain-containing protein n=1 Tax=Streptomyces sp. WMMB 322 TaxID=1286821 RepID=UPI0006E3B67F|nr:zf-HC2 domain-containing protein [Streptomyces sp. WMMB 322]SCK50376.1 Putative zinc-finger [Streptomyces sp. WMMB 322]